MKKSTGLMTIICAIVITMVFSVVYAGTQQEGKQMGKFTMSKEFDKVGQNCNKLDKAYDRAIKVCNTFPDKKYKAGCIKGVDKKYETIQWNVCAPSSDECIQFGELASGMIAENVCNVYSLKHHVIPENMQMCFDAAVDECRASVLSDVNDLVDNGSCRDNDGDPIADLFSIYDFEIRDAKNQCEIKIKAMFGM